jgi:mevalonate kinase
MGDHAVVYGYPAIIAAINKRLTVTVAPADKLTVDAPEGEKFIRYIITAVTAHFGIVQIPRVKITVTSDIPIGYHLGSSAAVAAGVAGALSYYLKKIWNPQLINQLAYECEKMIHRNPSGADPAAVVSGGLVWYRKELEFLRSIWQLPFSVSDTLNHFYLIDTGRPIESTGGMVVFVGSGFKIHALRYGKIFTENEIQTKRVAVALKENNEMQLIDAIQCGERTLERMGVVSQQIVPMLRQIEKSGGAAKILGGGGRIAGVGFLLCYHPQPDKVRGITGNYGYSYNPVTLGAPGIKLEGSV